MSYELDALYEEAHQDKIEVCGLPLKSLTAISAPCNDGFIIGLNNDKLCTEEQKTVCLAHEIGHCKTGGFYSMESDSEFIVLQEAKATEWAVHRLIPFDRLEELLLAEQRSPDVIAKHFGVTEEFVQKALRFYGIRNSSE